MPLVSKMQLKAWFVTAAKPLQGQYWDWMDSYWHKSELIPMSSVDHLVATLNTIAPLPPITGTITAPGGTIALAGGRLYRDLLLKGTGTVSIGTVADGNDIVNEADIELPGEDYYHTYINKKRVADFTLYITCTQDFDYEIFRV